MQNAVKDAAQSVETLALYNPLLAFMLTRGQPMFPRIYTVTLQWDSAAANQTLNGIQLGEPMYQLFWIKYMTYTIRRPSFNVGVFAAREQDDYTRKNPYIDLSIQTSGRGKSMRITEGMTPLEHVASPAGDPNHISLDWVLAQDQNVKISAVNTRAFDIEEPPYIVHLSLVGLELSGCELPSCAFDEVVCQLRNEGLYPQPRVK